MCGEKLVALVICMPHVRKEEGVDEAGGTTTQLDTFSARAAWENLRRI